MTTRFTNKLVAGAMAAAVVLLVADASFAGNRSSRVITVGSTGYGGCNVSATRGHVSGHVGYIPSQRHAIVTPVHLSAGRQLARGRTAARARYSRRTSASGLV